MFAPRLRTNHHLHQVLPFRLFLFPLLLFVMGVGAVATYLLADEVEHYRCGIGCVLESNRQTGQVWLTGLVRGGSAFASNEFDEGDEFLQIDSTRVQGMSLDDVSGLIRGKEGSVVMVIVRKVDGSVRTVRMVRQRLPGSKTEMLGALWQKQGESPNSKGTHSLENKMDVLAQLRARGNLTEQEYQQALVRLRGESSDISSPSKQSDHWYDSGRMLP